MKNKQSKVSRWLNMMAIVSLMMFANTAAAGGMNPCGASNPCGAAMNPCGASNPCGAAMNPCSASENTPIRSHAFNNVDEAITLGKKLWADESLGTSGVACLSCHADNELLNFDKKESFPHYVNMVSDVVSLDQMINYCMMNPMKGKAFPKNSKEQTAMAAYYQSYRAEYLRTHP